MVQIVRDDIEGLNKVTEKIIGLAIKVHNRLGQGFTEKIYQEALCLEFGRSYIHSSGSFISEDHR